MSLKLGGWGQSRAVAAEGPGSSTVERCLSLLAEGAAAGVPEMDAESYHAFRAKVTELAHRLPDRLPDEEKLALIGSILREFEGYRNGAETALREQLAAWRNLVTSLTGELFMSLAVDTASAEAAPLLQLVKRLTAKAEIDEWGERLDLFLHPLSIWQPG